MYSAEFCTHRILSGTAPGAGAGRDAGAGAGGGAPLDAHPVTITASVTTIVRI
jgi:hypothetical protein